MREVVLLGAGASVDAGVPASTSMGRTILAMLRSKPETQQAADVLSFVAGGLAFRDGARGGDPLAGANVEELFNAVNMLADRHRLDVAPFVGSWHPSVDEWDRKAAEAALLNLHRSLYDTIAGAVLRPVQQVAATARTPFAPRIYDSNKPHEIDRAIAEVVEGHRPPAHGVGGAIESLVVDILGAWSRHVQYRPDDGTKFAKQMLEILQGVQPNGGGGRVFADTAKAMISALTDLCQVTDATKVAYLRPILELAERQRRLVVASLNYDTCIELLAKENAATCRVGVRQQGDDSGQLDFAPDGVVLLKLHGSIDWMSLQRTSDPGARMPMPIVMKVPRLTGGEPPAVIFGGQNKLRAEWPFFELFRVFQEELFRANRLTVVGYSFQDEHINQCLSQWLNRDRTTRVVVVDPCFDTSSAPYAAALRRLGADRLVVLKQKAGDGLQNVLKLVTAE